MKRAARMFCCFVLILLSVLGLPCASAENDLPALYLDCRTDASGMIILNIMIGPSGTSLCGLELEVAYDTELLYLSSCERGRGIADMQFDCSLGQGRIKLLFWSQSNCFVSGNIATVCFVPTPDVRGGEKCEFYLSLPTKNSAIAFDGSNIIAKELGLTGLEFVMVAEGQKNEIPSDTEDNQFATEPMTEPATESATKLPSESATDGELPNDADSQGQITMHPTPRGRAQRTARVVRAMLFAVTVLCAFELIPLFIPKLFRKGYF